MACKIYFRRLVALLLCCVLVGSSFTRSAHASDPVTASLTVAGGALSAGGLTGEAAVASLGGPVAAVVGVVLLGCGVNSYVSKAAQSAGKTRTRFVLDTLVTYTTVAHIQKDKFFEELAQGIYIAADGTIQLTKDAAQKISQFVNWMFTQGDEYIVPEIASSGTVASWGDYSLYPVNIPYTQSTYPDITTNNFPLSGTFSYNNQPLASGAFYTGASSQTGYAIVLSGKMVLLCSHAFTSKEGVRFNLYSENRAITGTGTFYGAGNSGTVGSYYYYLFNPANVTLQSSSAVSFYSDTISAFTSNVAGKEISVTDVPATDEAFVSSPGDWATNKDLLNPAADDDKIVVNPDLLNPLIDQLAQGQQATMGITDYLEALQSAFDQSIEDVKTGLATITDSLTGIQEQLSIPDTAVSNPSITNPSTVPETSPIVDPSVVDPGTVITGMSYDLTSIFPFCIPFDIYAMLTTLSAEPVAPSYHVHYEGPYSIVIDFTVDLSSWNSVAAVLRTVELLAFCIGLAYVTRSMFIRS